MLIGACKNPTTLKDGFPFMFENDYSLMISVDGTTKTPTCVASLSCSATNTHGITELTMTDHDLSPMTDADSWLYPVTVPFAPST